MTLVVLLLTPALAAMAVPAGGVQPNCRMCSGTGRTPSGHPCENCKGSGKG